MKSYKEEMNFTAFFEMSTYPVSNTNMLKNLWNTFNRKTISQYHDLNLKSDILLLADVFENFRNTCLLYNKLDPCHYFTFPELSWDVILKN